MTHTPLRFALFGKRFQDDRTASVRRIFATLASHGAEVYVEREFYEYITGTLDVRGGVDGVFDGYNFDVDFCLSVGGDGTFLRTAAAVGAKGTPILGINTGRLGFLADVLPTETDTALESLIAGDYEVERHTVIRLEADGEPIEGNPYALNEIAVLKRDIASMISIRTSVDGEYLVTYQADGLIVSTPTGSTAYNLSNGGPIIAPGTATLCITPVAPHSLNVRPIVVADSSQITLEVESRSHNFLVAIDGRSEKLIEGTRLSLSRAPYYINVIRQSGHRYFSTLRSKMMWGADKR